MRIIIWKEEYWLRMYQVVETIDILLLLVVFQVLLCQIEIVWVFSLPLMFLFSKTSSFRWKNQRKTRSFAWPMRLFYAFSEKQHSPTFDLTLIVKRCRGTGVPGITFPWPHFVSHLINHYDNLRIEGRGETLILTYWDEVAHYDI